MNAPSVSSVPQRRARERSARREAILAAAERVVIARGFAEASIDAIAGEAGLAAGTVYLYFPNRDALLQDLLSAKVRLLNEAVAARMGAGAEFARQVPEVVRAMFRHFEEQRGFFEIFVRERMELSRGTGPGADVLREIEAGTARMARWIASAQRARVVPAGNPRHLATALRGLVFQFTRDWLRAGGRGRLSPRTAFVVQFFLKGAGV